MRKIIFVGTSLEDLRRFPEKARRRAGYELGLIQEGLDPFNWKPMKSIGPGVREIRIKVGEQYRVIYLVSRGINVYVLHAFQKKTQKTALKDIELARKRLRAVGD